MALQIALSKSEQWMRKKEPIKLLKEGIGPSIPVVLDALKVCGCCRDMDAGTTIHRLVAQTGTMSNSFVANTVIDMYAKCGSMHKAEAVFESLHSRDAVSWNCMILGYAHNGEGQKALDLYGTMLGKGVVPTSVTFVGLIKACTVLSEKEDLGTSLELVRLVHSQAVSFHCDSTFRVASGLVSLYAKCGSMQDAWTVFERIKNPDVVAWTAIIMAYADHGKCKMALFLYWMMQQEQTRPDAVTFVAALRASSRLDAKNRQPATMALHCQAVSSGYETNVSVSNTIMEAYAKCNTIECARRIFDRMLQRNVVSWNSMILGYADNGKALTGLELFDRMQTEDCAPQPDDFTFLAALKACSGLTQAEGKLVREKLVKVECLERARKIHLLAKQYQRDELGLFVACTLIDVYAKCGSLEEAWSTFQAMPHCDIASWNCVISAHAQCGEGQRALEVYASLYAEEYMPDGMTFVAAIKACCAGPMLEGISQKGMAIHSQCGQHASNKFVGSSLVDLYSKSGCLGEASRVFELMPTRNVASWNCIISRYAETGQPQVALDYYFSMDHERDAITYSAALKACGCLGALEVGRQVHNQICLAGLDKDSSLATSLVDFYGKCGCMVEAQAVFDMINSKDLVAWNALMAGYGRQGDISKVFNLFETMQKVVQLDGVAYLTVLTTCNHSGLVEQGKKYFEAMVNEHGIFPSADHCAVMVDMLARVGQLDVSAMFEMATKGNNAAMWMSLLSAAWKSKNTRTATSLAFKSLPSNAAAYVILSNTLVQAEFTTIETTTNSQSW